MPNEKGFHIPELLINNTEEKAIANVNGEEVEVKLPIKEGFNVQTRDHETGEFTKQFYRKELVAQVLYDRYEIKSKYKTKDFFFSNEFSFEDRDAVLRVYSPTLKKVIYEGPYRGAKSELTTTGEDGKLLKLYDVFAVIYLLHDNNIFRLKWKMNSWNNWFDYKDKSLKEFSKFHEVKTIFNLVKTKVGQNEFYTCTASLGPAVSPQELSAAEEAINTLNALNVPTAPLRIEKKAYPEEPQKSIFDEGPLEIKDEDIEVDKIPF